jgi:aspartate aminotransferase
MKSSLTLEAKNIKLDRIKRNLPVYDGGLGENPLPPPKSMIKNINKYSHLKDYSSSTGIKELKDVLGNKIIVGNGLKPLLFNMQLSFSKLYPKGTIIHIIPQWVSYEEQTNLIKCNTIKIDCDKNWKISSKNIEDALSKINNESLIIFNNPNNPSGCIYNKNEVKELAKIFEKYNTIVIADDIYSEIIHPKYKNEYGYIKHYYKKVISGSSLSKTFACGGYRLGWFVFPEDDLDDLYKANISIASSIYSCPTLMLQYVAAEALKFPNDIHKQMIFQENMYQNISEFCKKRFLEMNLKFSNSKAAWYYLIDFSYYKDILKKNNILDSNTLSKKLANNIGFITVTGSAFSIKQNYILRYSYVDIKDIDIDNNYYNIDNIKKGMNVLDKWLKDLYIIYNTN